MRLQNQNNNFGEKQTNKKKTGKSISHVTIEILFRLLSLKSAINLKKREEGGDLERY